jgi:hypothetical protein
VGATVKKTMKYGEIVVGENIRQEAIASNYLASLSSNNPVNVIEKDRILSLYSGMPYEAPKDKGKASSGRSTMTRG